MGLHGAAVVVFDVWHIKFCLVFAAVYKQFTVLCKKKRVFLVCAKETISTYRIRALMHHPTCDSVQKCTGRAAAVLWLFVCMARHTAAIPPCVSPILAQNCYTLETLLGRTDWSVDNFNSEAEWQTFVSKYMTAADAFPHETTVKMKQHEMTVFFDKLGHGAPF